ncbi:MAG: MFS transporter, partial [Chitinophagaceae bacterium]
VPNQIDTEAMADENKTNEAHLRNEKSGPLKYPQLVLGMLAIFVYVGVEVSTASNLPEFMKQHLMVDGKPFPTERMAPYISLFWASLMIGRWTGAAGAFDVNAGLRKMLQFLMPYLAFGVFLGVNKIANHDITPFYLYALVITVMIAGDILSKGNPARQLLIFSMMGIAALFVGMLSDGMISVYAFISVGLFCSTLWPCIFTLAVAGLGKHTNEGASLLIMMIMGGGVISLLQGFVADELLGIQWSYLVGVACFAYLAFYGIRAKALLKEQGIDYDQKRSAAH